MKILSIRKRTLLVLLAVAIGVGGVVVAASIADLPAVASNGMTVVIDAGHGGRDGGVVGAVTGVAESEINLAICKSLRHFLREAGYTVVMTRTNMDGLYGNVSGGFKKADMRARRDIIVNASARLVVSVHQNYYPKKSIRGAQVFYAPNSEDGAAFAALMQGVLVGALPVSNREVKSGDYYILQCTDVPALLIECGFLSNPIDEANLVTAVYQEKVAFAIAAGVRLILGA